MKAISIYPKKPKSIELINLPTPYPKKGEVLVKTVEAGVCRTDLEIYEGLYGEAPQGEKKLILGHESLGRIEKNPENLTSLKKGDYVVRIVRRPCLENCLNCSGGENDMCLTGNYTEIGIKGIHGVMREYYTDSPEFLIKIPNELKEMGVLLEPLSFVEKTIRQAYKIQERLIWNPKRVLIFGAGPIGLFSTLTLKNKGLEVYTLARSKKGNLKSQIVEESGGIYIDATENELEKLGKFDLIIEATGSSSAIYPSLKILNKNGVLCLTSITGGSNQISLPLDKINLNLVLSNQAITGVVNSNIKDYNQGVEDLKNFEKKWPGLTKKFITKKVHFKKFQEAFYQTRQDIKTVIEFSK